MFKTLRRHLQMNRSVCGGILAASAVLLLLIAVVMERLGLGLGQIRPFTFIGSVVAVKMALFALWPNLTKVKSVATTPVLGHLFGKSSSRQTPGEPGSITLWDESSPRLSAALFSSNLPTFILSADQRLLDWNSAFGLVFGAEVGLKLGAPVSDWYGRLDNFRRVPARSAKLYGAGILPITDRERAVYVSPQFGRMVFTKVMAPLVDLASGRIIGWSVVLNVNSVHHRNEFFTALYATIEEETKRIRYAAGYDRLFDRFSGRQQLINQHLVALKKGKRILDVGCGTGAFSAALLGQGHRVTAVDGDSHLLRQARRRCAAFVRGKLVRKAIDDLRGLPQQRYDGAVLTYHLQTVADPLTLLQRIHASLVAGGLLLITLRHDGAGVDSLYAAVGDQLRSQMAFDEIKHQLDQVRSYAVAMAAKRASDPVDLATARALLEACGFELVGECHGLEDGQSVLLTARKS